MANVDKQQAAPAMRTCIECGISKPLTRAFAKFDKKRASRRKVCRACRNHAKKVQREARDAHSAVHKAAQQILDQKRDVKRLLTLVSKLVTTLGGIDCFVNEWAAAIEAAKKADRDHLVSRHLCATLDLLIVANELQHKPTRIPNLAKLTDRQLADLARIIGPLNDANLPLSSWAWLQ